LTVVVRIFEYEWEYEYRVAEYEKPTFLKA